VLVFGKTGQVATELQRLLPAAHFAGRDVTDLSRPGTARALIRRLEPDFIINAAAYTAVDKAEQEEALARRINGDAPTEIALAAAELFIPLVHISTDYVFDGSGDAPWRPDDETAPLGAYGRSKAMGEVGVRESGASYAILRTAWVFSAHGGNFVKTMLRLSDTHDTLNVVADQFGGPTPAEDIAATCVTIARALRDDPLKSGTYHYSGAPDVHWAAFAREIFAQAGKSTQVQDIPSSDYLTPAVRPANSKLDCATLETVFGIRRPDWRAGLADVLKEIS
jgi:dTDP-4-dehydrorhamnose reductase